MLAAGAPIPDVAVWTTMRERSSLHDLVAARPALLFFYLFDWSST